MHVHIWSANVQTGGPWALAQLGSALRTAGHKVTITLPGESAPEDVDVVVAPEIAIRELCSVRGPLRVVWWLSVENAYWRLRREQVYDQLGPHALNLMDKLIRHPIGTLLREPGQRDILHLAQSEYARIHVASTLGLEPLMLTDYLTDIPALTEPIESGTRARCVAYNPAKGLPATLRVIRELDGEVDFRPIKGLSHTETVKLLRGSLIYLDLGGHPGRDRLPREAALAGCILLVGKRGAAINKFDYPIPDHCKLSVPWRFQSPEAVVRRIREVIAQPESYLSRMKQVDEIFQQESVFLHEVDGLVEELHRRLETKSECQVN
jgi:hypothetical protein